MVEQIRESFLFSTIEVLAYIFVFVIGLAALAVIVIYISDRMQTTHAVRRNYPVIGHFRYFFENLGDKTIYDEFDLVVDLEF